MTPLRCGKCINTGLYKVMRHPKSILSEDRPALLERMKLKVCICTFTKNSGCVHYDLCSLQYTGIQLWQLLIHQGCISTESFQTAALSTSFMSIHIHSSDRFRLSEGQEQKKKKKGYQLHAVGHHSVQKVTMHLQWNGSKQFSNMEGNFYGTSSWMNLHRFSTGRGHLMPFLHIRPGFQTWKPASSGQSRREIVMHL